MYGKKKITKNVTKLMAILLAIVCVMQTVNPVNVKADNVNYIVYNGEKITYYEEETSDGRILKIGTNATIEEGRDYTMDANGCVTLLSSGVELLQNGVDGVVFSWDYNAVHNMTSITLPDGMTSINDCAFSFCYALESITIPDSVTYVGGYETFRECKSLKSITIPENVEGMVIDDTTFNGCESLKKVTISGKGTTIKGGSFSSCSYRYDNILSSIVINDAELTLESGAFRAAYVKKIVLPEGLTEIPDEAFLNCNVLTSINIPSTVTKIGDWAFTYDSKLKSITIPKNVTYIGECAFCDCSAMTSVTFKKNTSTSKKLTIGKYAFEHCLKLTSLTIPRNVKIISANAFYKCESLKKITIKGNVDTIKDDAIYTLGKLSTVVITGNVGKIGWVYNYGDLKKIEIRGTLGSGLKKLQANKVIVNGKTYRWKWVTPETIDQYEWTSQTSVYEYGEYMLVQVK